MNVYDDSYVLPEAGFSLPKEGQTAIVVMRALPGLGDFLCVVPALRALRTACPDAHITLIGLKETRQLADRFRHFIDCFLPFPGYPGLKEQPVFIPDLLVFLATVFGRFDLALQLHGSGIVSNSFTVLLGARRTAGFYLPGQYCPDPDNFIHFSEQEQEVVRCLRLMTFLGIPAQGLDLEFPLTDEDYRDYERLRQFHPLKTGHFVCLHPGASQAAKRWPAACFAAVGDALAEQGFQIVLTGSERERQLTRATAARMIHSAVDLGGRSSLGALALLLKDARLLISNDTGVAHLADALSVPGVTIFQKSNPSRWAALDKERRRIVVSTDGDTNEWEGTLSCAGIQEKRADFAFSRNGKPAYPLIPVTAVLNEIEALLDRSSPAGRMTHAA